MSKRITFFTNDGVSHQDNVKAVRMFSSYPMGSSFPNGADRLTLDPIIIQKEDIDVSIQQNVLGRLVPSRTIYSSGTVIGTGEWISHLGSLWERQWFEYHFQGPVVVYQVTVITAGTGNPSEQLTGFALYSKFSLGGTYKFCKEVSFPGISALEPQEIRMYLESGVKGRIFKIVPTQKSSFAGLEGSFQVRWTESFLVGMEEDQQVQLLHASSVPFQNLRAIDFGPSNGSKYAILDIQNSTDPSGSWNTGLNLSVFFWYKRLPSTLSTETLFSFGNQVHFQVANDRLVWTYGSSTVSGTTTIPQNDTWFHVGFSVGSVPSSVQVYVNGVNDPLTGVLPSTALDPSTFHPFICEVAKYASCRMDEVIFLEGAVQMLDVSKLYLRGVVKNLLAQDISNNVLGYWRFEDVSAYRAEDSSGKHNHWKLFQKPMRTRDVRVAAQDEIVIVDLWENKLCLFFDGEDDYGSCTTGISGSYSLSMWVKCTQYPVTLVEIDSMMSVQVAEHGMLSIVRGEDIFLTDYHVILDIWSYLTIIQTDTQVLVYAQGKNVATMTSSEVALPSGTLRFGQSSNGFSTYSIDEVAVWDTALTAAHVIELYHSGEPFDLRLFSMFETCSGYWTFDDNQGSLVPDRSGKGHPMYLGSSVNVSNDVNIYLSGKALQVQGDETYSASVGVGSQISVSEWVYLESDPSIVNYVLISLGDENDSPYVISYSPSSLSLQMTNGVQPLEYIVDPFFMMESWNHIGGVWGDTVSLYLNGACVAQDINRSSSSPPNVVSIKG